MPFGDDQSDPGGGRLASCCQNQKMPTASAILNPVENPTVIFGSQQTSGSWEAVVGTLRQTGSGAQTLAAFGTATGNHLAAVFGGHTSTETVAALTLDNTGLKSTFHVDNPEIRVLNQPLSFLGLRQLGEICSKIGTQF